MNKALAMAAIAAPAALAGENAEQPAADFVAARVVHSGTVHVDAPPEQAFQLFTAPGEKLWINDWDPVVLNGGDGRESGAVFVTGHHGERTIWIVIDHDPEKLHALYARVAPASRAGTVEVFARPDGRGATEVDISYQLTALSESGNRDIAGFDEKQFGAMIAEWEETLRTTEIDYQALGRR